MLPFQAHSTTSRQAAKKARRRSKLDRVRVLEYVRSRGPLGATSDEVQRRLHLAHQTGSARVAELLKQGFIVESGRRRLTVRGCLADVLVEAPPGTPARMVRGRREPHGFTESELARLSLELQQLHADLETAKKPISRELQKLLQWLRAKAPGAILTK